MKTPITFLTAGSVYLDIDAYACMVAMTELLRLQGISAAAYSPAVCNYSICDFLCEEGQVLRRLPADIRLEDARYIIVDVSDPEYIRDSVPVDQVSEVFDHHVGFEEYWRNRIWDKARIEFIGAAATLIYREWKKAGLQDRMSRSSALLLIAAILDNTLNLTSANTTPEDIETFRVLCEKENVGDEWRARYFSEVQTNVEADLKNALLHDLKTIGEDPILPPRMAQLCVWDANRTLQRLPEISTWLADCPGSWMLNLIDIHQHCSYFVCGDPVFQKQIEQVFDVHFEEGIARSARAYLRKEIIKKARSQN